MVGEQIKESFRGKLNFEQVHACYNKEDLKKKMQVLAGSLASSGKKYESPNIKTFAQIEHAFKEMNSQTDIQRQARWFVEKQVDSLTRNIESQGHRISELQDAIKVVLVTGGVLAYFTWGLAALTALAAAASMQANLEDIQEARADNIREINLTREVLSDKSSAFREQVERVKKERKDFLKLCELLHVEPSV